MFSQRTLWNLQDNALTLAVAERRALGLPVLDLTETNPTRVNLPFPHAEVAEALQHPDNRLYVPEPFGLPTAREAVAHYHGDRVPPEHVILTASTSEAYSWLFKLLCDPGDRVLIPTPSYPLFEYLATLESVAVDPYPSRYVAGEWHVDLEALRDAVTERTRAVLLVSPNNPTGAVLHTAEREAIVALCAQRGLALISDEVFADTLDPRLIDARLIDARLIEARLNDRAATLAGEDRCLTFVLSGLSKVCLLPQLKLAWIAASGPAPLLPAALARLEVIADTCLSLATPVQHALPRLLALRPRIQAAVRQRLDSHRLALVQAMHGSIASVLPADGGWSAILRVPRLLSDEAWALHLLRDHGLLLQPGWFFDMPTEGHMIMGLLADDATFLPGVDALRIALDAA